MMAEKYKLSRNVKKCLFYVVIYSKLAENLVLPGKKCFFITNLEFDFIQVITKPNLQTTFSKPWRKALVRIVRNR